MTRASGVGARLVLDAIPALPGALESLANGYFSSLQAGNQKIAALISSSDRSTTDPRIQLLFDPQTSGGLIAGVPPERVDSCLEALRAQGDADAAVVGEVVPLVEGESPFILA
jgi:selenide,water dikinase